MPNLGWLLAALILDGLAPVIGVLLPMRMIHALSGRLISFATGSLLGVAFLDLIPEAMEVGTPSLCSIAALSGFLVFHLLEAVVGHGEASHGHGSHIAPSILLGDALHNITDGVAVASAFLVDIRMGIVSAVAVFIHELPQEIGDFAVLVNEGFSKKRALFWLVVVQFSAILGALGVYLAAGWTARFLPGLLAFSAGGFIHVAAVGLLPKLRCAGLGERVTRLAFIILGALTIAVIQYGFE